MPTSHQTTHAIGSGHAIVAALRERQRLEDEAARTAARLCGGDRPELKDMRCGWDDGAADGATPRGVDQ